MTKSDMWAGSSLPPEARTTVSSREMLRPPFRLYADAYVRDDHTGLDEWNSFTTLNLCTFRRNCDAESVVYTLPSPSGVP